MDLWLIFLTGLTVGGLTCLAVQGGLLASTIATRESDDLITGAKGKHIFFPTLAFLTTKLIAYTLLGFILGAFGGAININPNVQTGMQLFAGLYMIAVAMNLLNVHPIFRYAIIQPPRLLTRMVKNQSKSKDLFAPAILGAMTIFIPCGTTIAMETLAISSANPVVGASIMAAFILGTAPLFFGLGFITSTLGDAYHGKFLKLTAVLVLYLGITSVNGSLVAFGSPLTLQALAENFPISINLSNPEPDQKPDLSTNQNFEIAITSAGYEPSYGRVKKGLPVHLTLTSKDSYSCASAFRIPSLGISANLAPNDTKTITFVPEKAGKIPFTCSMGMYRGVIEVI